MVRYVTRDQWFKAESSEKEYLIRKGDRVAIYPPALHKDPEIFEEPDVSSLNYESAFYSFNLSCFLEYVGPG